MSGMLNNAIRSPSFPARLGVFSTPASLGKRILPWRCERLIRLGQDKNANPHNNRRKRTSPELQEYIKGLQTKDVNKQIIRDFRELAHYAYVFDIEHYKSQLEPAEAEDLQSIGDVIFHYCSSGSRKGIDPSNLFDTSNYLSKYPDVKKSGLNPMVHCFKFGMNEKRFSMDNIHFMRKIDIKKPNTEALDSIRQDLKTKKVGVFLHIFYPELGETIAAYLKNIPCSIDIFVSTKEESVQALQKIFSRIDNAQKVDVRHFSNIGRDVAPFFIGCPF